MTYLSPLQPGLSCAGDGMPMHGRLRNLAASELTYQTAGVTWAHEPSTQPSATAQAIIYVDGRLRTVTDAADGASDIADLGVGDSSAQLFTAGAYDRALPVSTDQWGQNALIEWTPSVSTDCAGYNIYNADASLRATVTDVGVHERISAAPDSGAGAGRISAWGAVPDFAGNDTGALTVTGEGEAEFTFPGYAAESISFNRGTVVQLRPGFALTFLDDPAAYQVGDAWDIRVGPAASYVTEALEPGEYQFTVKAIDGAGNESGPQTSPTIYIPQMPGALTAVSTTYAADTLTVTFAVPAGADGVRVYTNFNPHTGEFEPYIATGGLPFADVTTGSWVFDPAGAEGQLLYYLRPYNAVTERDSGDLYTFNFPPTAEDSGVNLDAPTGLTVTPTAGGNWRLEWDYLLAGSAATGFNIYRHVGDSEINYASDYLITIPTTWPDSTGSTIKHFGYDSTAPEAGVVRLAVRATDGTLESAVADYVTLMPDATAPVFAGPVVGGAA